MGLPSLLLADPARARPMSGQTRTCSLGAARPLRPSADIVGPGGQSVGQAEADTDDEEADKRCATCCILIACPRRSTPGDAQEAGAPLQGVHGGEVHLPRRRAQVGACRPCRCVIPAPLPGQVRTRSSTLRWRSERHRKICMSWPAFRGLTGPLASLRFLRSRAGARRRLLKRSEDPEHA